MKHSLFSSGKLPWWIIGVSIVMGSGVLVSPQMLSSALADGDLSGMWMLWSGAITEAVGVAFFAHLWRKVPVSTENELLLFRFSGRGAQILHAFRGVYVGGFVVPFIIAFAFLAFGNVLTVFLGISLSASILLSLFLVLVGTAFNSLRQRIRFDFFLLLFFAVLFTLIMAWLISDAGGLFHIQSQVASAKLNVGIVPQNGTRAFNAFLVFMLLQWWSASISDLPDMTGQKLMATKNVRDVAKTIIFPQILSITIGLFVFLLPFIARTDGLLQASANPEQAFLSVFVNHLPAGLLVAAAAMFLISFLSVVLNNLNWGGALLVQNVYRYHIRHKATKEALNRVGVATMLVLACFGAAIAFFSESLLGIARYIFAITAGVGPVFILRWYWWRINAWSQFSAMVAALIIPNVFDLMMLTYSPFNQEVMALCGRWNMDLYPFKIIVFSILVTFVWIVVTFATAPDDEITLSKFASTVKPGGFWPKRFGAGNVFLMPRLFVWLILAVQGLLVYILFWQFSQGNYLTSSACLIAFLGLMYVAYKLLSSVNQKAK